MRKPTHIVDEKVTQTLLDMVVVVFDGWSAVDTHYFGVFATYPADTSTGFKKHLFCFSPMVEEDSQDATQSSEYVKYVLEVYVMTVENVCYIIGENTATNKAIERRVGSLFLGC